MPRETVDVVVVGAGIMGASAAWHLARRGLRVVLAEQFTLDHVRGSSHGASRIFRLGYEQPDYVRLAERALPVWREAESALGIPLLRTTGALDIGSSADLDPVEAALLSTGAPVERLSSAESRRRFPQHPVPAGWELLHQPQGGVLLANDCRLGLARLASDAGATIHQQTRVTALAAGADGVSVIAGDTTWEADHVVIAVAGWANGLLAPLGLQVPLTITREHVAYYAAPGSSLPFIWHEGTSAFAFYGLPNGARAEMKVGQHGAGPETDPDLEGTIDAERLEPVEAFVRRHLPHVSRNALRHETCLYASTPDDDFVLDRIDRVVLGLGFGGHGFKFGSIVGSILADLVEGEHVPDLDRFRYDRFITGVPA